MNEHQRCLYTTHDAARELRAPISLLELNKHRISIAVASRGHEARRSDLGAPTPTTYPFLSSCAVSPPTSRRVAARSPDSRAAPSTPLTRRSQVRVSTVGTVARAGHDSSINTFEVYKWSAPHVRKEEHAWYGKLGWSQKVPVADTRGVSLTSLIAS